MELRILLCYNHLVDIWFSGACRAGGEHMGKYLNPGCVKFQRSLNSEIYIDKTEMIAYINSVVNTEQCYVCVSRPRRFGKTITANMLCAYYGKGNSGALFADRKLAGHENWDRYLNNLNFATFITR